MKRKVLYICFVMVLVPSVCLAFSFSRDNIMQFLNWEEQTSSLTADLVSTTEANNQTMSNNSKIYKKGDTLIRMDLEPKMLKAMMQGKQEIGNYYIINNIGLKKTYMVFPSKKGYVEADNEQMRNTMEQVKGRLQQSMEGKSPNITSFETLGTESVEGIKCQKVHFVTAGQAGGTTDVTAWLSEKYQNFPIKVVMKASMPNGNTVTNTTQFKNIVYKTPDSSLFEIPSDYTRHDNMISLMTGGQYTGEKIKEGREKMRKRMKERWGQ